MLPYVVLDKKQGETPLQALTTWKKAHPDYRDTPASYAGRLDPMAEGKLLVLFGEECKRQAKYTGLDKEYEIEVLLDVGSDTGDALGIASYSGKETRVDAHALTKALRLERGKHMRAYPAYSSKTVAGKPLFLHALSGTLSDVTIPEHEERIYRISHQGTTLIDTQVLRARLDEFFLKVPMSDEPSKELGADFRIAAVRESWKQVFENASERSFSIIRLRVVCGSGTYMRTLAPRIGAALGTSALALSIRRTRIGKYWNGLWLKSY